MYPVVSEYQYALWELPPGDPVVSETLLFFQSLFLLTGEAWVHYVLFYLDPILDLLRSWILHSFVSQGTKHSLSLCVFEKAKSCGTRVRIRTIHHTVQYKMEAEAHRKEVSGRNLQNRSWAIWRSRQHVDTSINIFLADITREAAPRHFNKTY